VLIVVGPILVQDSPKMCLVPDEGAVQEFASVSADPAFDDRVHTRRLYVAKHAVRMPASARTASNTAVRIGPAVADHELNPVSLLAEVREEVAGLLGGPLPGGMQGDPEDAIAPVRVHDHGQDVGLGAVEQLDREEVARQDRRPRAR
jgi:hypothetical protein